MRKLSVFVAIFVLGAERRARDVGRGRDQGAA